MDPSFQAAALAVLAALGVAPNPVSVGLLMAWSWCEKPHYAGGAWQWDNPLNTTLPTAGSYAANSAGVQVYPSQQAGAAACAATLQNGYYPHLLAALQQGNAALFFAWPQEVHTWGTDPACIVANYAPASVSTGAVSLGAPVVAGSAAVVALVVVSLAAIVGGGAEIEEERRERRRAR